MVVEYHAAAPFHFFGVDYAVDELIDTSGFDARAMRALLREPVYAVNTASVSSGIVHETAGAPADTLGADGDWAYDPVDNVIYGPKTAGAWPAGIALAEAVATANALATKAARPAAGLDGKLTKWDEASASFLDGGTATVITGKADKPGAAVDQKPVKWDDAAGQFADASGTLHTLYTGTGPPPAASPQLVGVATANAQFASAFNLPLPVGSKAGHLALVVDGANNGTAFTTSGGLTQLSQVGGIYCGWKFLTAADITNGFLAFSGSTQYSAACIEVYSDVDPTTPIENFAASAATAAASVNAPAAVTSKANCRAVYLAGGTANTGNIAPSSAAVTRDVANGGDASASAIFSELFAAAGTHTQRSINNNWSGHTFQAFTVSVRPNPAAVASDGDYYLDKTAKNFYGPMAAGAWGAAVPLAGVTSDANGNTKSGTSALAALTTGLRNTANGTSALAAVTSSSDNTAYGYQALQTTTGTANTAVGENALRSLGLANSSTAVGWQALTAATTGGANTAVGASALQALTTGASNVGMGTSALFALTTGSNNTAVGSSALMTGLTVASSTAVGFNALKLTTVGFCTAVGAGSLAADTTGGQNTAVGYNSMTLTTTGSRNTAIGYQALQSNLTGNDNTVLGSTAAATASAGSSNTYLGSSAASNATTGNQNVAIGHQALASMTTGSTNVCIGYQAGQANGPITVGINNTLVGATSSPTADRSNTTALGAHTSADANGATAIGVDSAGTGASTTTQDEMKLGTALTTVRAGKDIATAQPSANGTGKWQLGKVVAGVAALDTANYLEVMVDGVVKKIALST